VMSDARFDRADQVSAHVSSLGVDAAAQLSEQRHERRAEAKADDLEWHGRWTARTWLPWNEIEAAERPEHQQDAQQAHRHNQEARDGAAAHRDIDGVAHAALSSGGGAQVRLDGDEHT